MGIKESFRDIGRSQMSWEMLEKVKDNEEMEKKEEDMNEEGEQVEKGRN